MYSHFITSKSNKLEIEGEVLSLIIVVYKIPTTNTKLTGKVFYPHHQHQDQGQEKHGCPQLLYNMMPGVPARAIKQENEIKDTLSQKEATMFLFLYCVI